MSRESITKIKRSLGQMTDSHEIDEIATYCRHRKVTIHENEVAAKYEAKQQVKKDLPLGSLVFIPNYGVGMVKKHNRVTADIVIDGKQYRCRYTTHIQYPYSTAISQPSHLTALASAHLLKKGEQ